jgi:hypothetical protein
MDKINESMEKIGAMLGVQHSNSNMGASDANSISETKKAPLIKKEKELVHVSSAEGRVVGPPVTANDTVYSANTTTTKPTTPGKTKTPAGAAIASFAAAVDNTMNTVNKSFRNMGGYSDKACGGKDAEKGAVHSDGSTVTEYVAIEKPRRIGETPKWVYVAVASALAVLVCLAISAAVPGTRMNSWFSDVNNDMAASTDKNISVAFVGNSYLFVNDVPRVMESISKGRIAQQSVINTAAGLGSLLKQGNGMYEIWGEESPNSADYWKTFDFHALMEKANIDIDEDYVLRDYGYCTVPQLLDGFDNYLSYRNQNGVYLDVGTNPCFEDEYYMMIMQEKSYSDPMYFDFVVLNDQTRRMVNEEGREDSLDALVQAYVPLIKTSRAVPILVDTHAFGVGFEDFVENQYYTDDYQDAEDASTYDGDGVEDYAEYYKNSVAATNQKYGGQQYGYSDEIPQFTASIYEGLYEYIDVLKENLPERQHPIIAKIGLAYLAIYEDDINQYAKLFAEDGIHASQHGTYLFACVLYCAMYGHLPMSVHDEFDVRAVFFRSRALFGSNTEAPSLSDANYLRKWAKKDPSGRLHTKIHDFPHL